MISGSPFAGAPFGSYVWQLVIGAPVEVIPTFVSFAPRSAAVAVLAEMSAVLVTTPPTRASIVPEVSAVSIGE